MIYFKVRAIFYSICRVRMAVTIISFMPENDYYGNQKFRIVSLNLPVKIHVRMIYSRKKRKRCLLYMNIK